MNLIKTLNFNLTSMVNKSVLPKWLSRGIEEYFPIQNAKETLVDRLHNAKNKRLR